MKVTNYKQRNTQSPNSYLLLNSGLLLNKLLHKLLGIICVSQIRLHKLVYLQHTSTNHDTTQTQLLASPRNNCTSAAMMAVDSRL